MYGEDCDAASRSVLGPLSRELALSRDAGGEQYAVVLRERGRPIAVLHIARADDSLGVWAYDDRAAAPASPACAAWNPVGSSAATSPSGDSPPRTEQRWMPISAFGDRARTGAGGEVTCVTADVLILRRQELLSD